MRPACRSSHTGSGWSAVRERSPLVEQPVGRGAGLRRQPARTASAATGTSRSRGTRRSAESSSVLRLLDDGAGRRARRCRSTGTRRTRSGRPGPRPLHHSEISPRSRDARAHRAELGLVEQVVGGVGGEPVSGRRQPVRVGRKLGIGPWWAARRASSLRSGTGPGLLARRGGVAVQRQQLLADRAVAHRSTVDPLVGERGAGTELVLLAGQVDDSRASRARRPSGSSPSSTAAMASLNILRSIATPWSERPRCSCGAVGDRALRHPRHDVLALDVVGDERAVLVAERELVDDRAILLVPRPPSGWCTV